MRHGQHYSSYLGCDESGCCDFSRFRPTTPRICVDDAGAGSQAADKPNVGLPTRRHSLLAVILDLPFRLVVVVTFGSSSVFSLESVGTSFYAAGQTPFRRGPQNSLRPAIVAAATAPLKNKTRSLFFQGPRLHFFLGGTKRNLRKLPVALHPTHTPDLTSNTTPQRDSSEPGTRANRTIRSPASLIGLERRCKFRRIRRCWWARRRRERELRPLLSLWTRPQSYLCRRSCRPRLLPQIMSPTTSVLLTPPPRSWGWPSAGCAALRGAARM